jgi:DNA-binding NtrC family response regulator
MPAQPGKILVVDDYLELARNTAEILELEGHFSVVAGSAEEALEIVAQGGIAVIITDFRLPGANGAELITAVRLSGLDIPAVVVSAYSDQETIDMAERAGACAVLVKPVDFRRLAEVLEVATGAAADGPAR